MSNRAKVENRAAFTLQNGLDAQALNRKFQGLTASSACTTGETACVKGQLGQCVGDKFALSSCASPLQCVALPLVNKPGTRYVLLWWSFAWEREAEREWNVAQRHVRYAGRCRGADWCDWCQGRLVGQAG